MAAASVLAPLPARDFSWVEAVEVGGEEDRGVMEADFPAAEVIAEAVGQAETGSDATQ